MALLLSLASFLLGPFLAAIALSVASILIIGGLPLRLAWVF